MKPFNAMCWAQPVFNLRMREMESGRENERERKREREKERKKDSEFRPRADTRTPTNSSTSGRTLVLGAVGSGMAFRFRLFGILTTAAELGET